MSTDRPHFDDHPIAWKQRWEAMREKICECGCAESWHRGEGGRCTYPRKYARLEAPDPKTRSWIKPIGPCECVGFTDSGRLGGY